MSSPRGSSSSAAGLGRESGTADFNPVTEQLSFDEVEKFHRESVAPPALAPLLPRGGPPRPPGGAAVSAGKPAPPSGKTDPPVMDDNEIDRLLKALGDDEAYKWIPTHKSEGER